MRNQKYLVWFQNLILHTFSPQKDRIDTEMIVFGPKHSTYIFWHINILLRFQRILMTWFIPSLYLLLKTFSSNVLTSKSLIWVEMIILGLFWTQNEISDWIWSITLSLHFGKPKVPIFVSKCYTTLIFAQKWPYGHRNDCIWTKT